MCFQNVLLVIPHYAFFYTETSAPESGLLRWFLIFQCAVFLPQTYGSNERMNWKNNIIKIFPSRSIIWKQNKDAPVRYTQDHNNYVVTNCPKSLTDS